MIFVNVFEILLLKRTKCLVILKYALTIFNLVFAIIIITIIISSQFSPLLLEDIINMPTLAIYGYRAY